MGEALEVSKVELKLPQVIQKVEIPSLVQALDRLVPEENRKYKVSETEARIVLMDIFKNHPDTPTVDVIEFFYKAMTSGAAPLNKDIYLIPFKESYLDGDQWKKRKKGNTVFSYHFINKCAEGTGLLDSIQVSSAEDGSEARCKVYKRGTSTPTMAAAYFDECVQLTKKGEPKGKWKTSPRSMLEKCAVAKGVRLAFPRALGGYYAEEELGAILRVREIEQESPRPSDDSSLSEELQNKFSKTIEGEVDGTTNQEQQTKGQ